MSVGLVLLAHSGALADGAAAVARQMAPHVPVEGVGGFRVAGEETLGTDVERAEAAVRAMLEAGHDVVLLGDLGSALLTAGLVVELLGPGLEARVRVASGPFVEGAVAAAVAAAGGADVDAVAAAVAEAARQWKAPEREESSRDAQEEARRVVLGNTTGLHARPAALLARLVAGFEARVTVNGAAAESVFELMKLAAAGGAELEVRASGPQASEALEAVAEAIVAGLGER